VSLVLLIIIAFQYTLMIAPLSLMLPYHHRSHRQGWFVHPAIKSHRTLFTALSNAYRANVLIPGYVNGNAVPLQLGFLV
jgi:hypothetical protein